MIKNPKIRKLLMLDKRRKRTTFGQIFAKAAVVALIISGLFSVFYHDYIIDTSYDYTESELSEGHL